MLPTEQQRGGSRSAGEGIVTADMVAQYAYCPRRFHLAYVEGRWGDNASTDQGRAVHARVDRGEALLPPPEKVTAVVAETLRGLTLHDEGLQLLARLDAVELRRDEASREAEAVPVETKSGEKPSIAEGAWPPERLQVMAQGLLLRRAGYRCERGVVYYAASKSRVDVLLDGPLEAQLTSTIASIRQALSAGELPPPLDASPKCPGCSLAGICLPDETVALRALESVREEPSAVEPRRLYPARDDALPFYVQEQGAYVGKQGEQLHVSKAGVRIAEVRLKDVSQLVLCGNVSVSPPALHLLCEASVPVVHLSYGHWFYGVTAGHGLRNAFDRAAQFRTAADAGACLRLARAFIHAKGSNQRTMLRRNAAPEPTAALDDMSRALDALDQVNGTDQLLGEEGRMAAAYFGNFGSMLRPRDPGAADGVSAFDFDTRNRRPPRDPVNALLSFGYAMLAKECTLALLAAGLDPYWGFFHRPRHGRPALALDLMEEFRPLVADSAVLTAINTGMVQAADFVHAASGCALTPSGRKAFIRAYEARLDTLATHPLFEYRCSWRRLISLQAQLLARVLRGDIPEYVGITTR